METRAVPAPPVWDTTTIDLGGKPGFDTTVEGVAADDRYLYATHYHSDPAEPKRSDAVGHVVVLDARTGVEVTRIPVGHQPRALAVDAQRHRLYVVNYHQDSYSVSIVDTTELAVRKEIPVLQGPIRVAVSRQRNRAYVTNWFQGRVHVIAGPGPGGTGDTLLTSVDIGRGVIGVAVDDTADRVHITVVHPDTEVSVNQVVSIDAATNAAGAPVDLPPLRSDPDAVAVDPISGHVFVSNLGQASTGGPHPHLTVLDKNLQTIGQIPLGPDATHLACDPATRQVYAVTPAGTYVIDTVTRTVVSIIPTGPTAFGAAVTPTGRILIGDRTEGRLTIATPAGTGPADLTITRPDDLLNLDFDFVNLRLEAGPDRPARLVRADPQHAALIIVRFPPQHLTEQTFGVAEQVTKRPVLARLAGASRLVFRLPADTEELPYTVDALLDWSNWDPVLVPSALPPDPLPGETTPPPPLVEPVPAQTALELPYRLVLSPDRTGRWTHAARPVSHDGRTELWHTRLRVADEPTARPALRAVWSPDLTGAAPVPFDGPITPQQRREIVRLTADFSLADPLPKPVYADELMLTPLGGYLSSRGSWTPPPTLSVRGWRHVATLGRDHNVRVEQVGVLLPFGHRAVQVTATEREFVPAPPNEGTAQRPAAVLRKRNFLLIAEPDKRFDTAAVADAYDNAGREMPLHAVRILSTATPDLLTTDTLGGTAAFWIRTAQGDLPIPVAATDAAGRTGELSVPMVFVPNAVANDAAAMAKVRNAYLENPAPPAAPRRLATLTGQPVAYAPPAAPTSDDTVLATEALLFGVQPVPVGVNDEAPYLPLVQRATVRVPVLAAVTGAGQSVEVEFFAPYLDGILDGPQNRAGVFLRLVQGIETEYEPPAAGGLASATLQYTGISRTVGALPGDLDRLADGTFDPSTLFAGAGRLLGTVPLSEVVDSVFALEQLPTLRGETLRDAAGVPQVFVARLEWQPSLRDVGPFRAGREENGQTIAASMTVRTRLEQQLPGAGAVQPPRRDVDGTLTNFSINFLDILTVNVAELTFRSHSGEKTRLTPVLAGTPMVFRRELNFLDELRRQIPSDAFGSLPRLDVTSQGIDIGYSLALPPLAFGAFTLQNVVLDGGLTLPFTDQPARIRFSFGTRNNPFNLSVLAVGGGGFVGIEVALNRIVAIEAALEMGGNAAVNLGVASAAVWVMGGIYFKLADGPDGADARIDLTAYLRYGGSVSVLGLVSVSVEFYLALSYDPQANLLHGQAKVTVKAKVAIFTKSVTLTVERTIAGPDLSDDERASLAAVADGTTFGDMVDEADWQRYVAAFA